MRDSAALNILEELERLALELEEAARAGDAPRASAVVSAREPVVARLLAAAAPGDAGEAAERARRLEAILAADARSAELLTGARERLLGELVSVGTGRRGLEGYGRAGARGGNCIDERR